MAKPRVPHQRFLIAQASVFFGLCALVAAITLIGLWDQGSNHGGLLDNREGVLNRNDFWLQLTGDRPLKLNTVRGKLARDLQPFLTDDLVGASKESSLIPDKLSDINVGSEKYLDLNHEVDEFWFKGTGDCYDCGTFTAEFLGSFEQVRNNRLNDVLEKVPPKPVLHYTSTFLAWPWIIYGPVFLFGISTIAFLAALCICYAGYAGRYYADPKYPNSGRNWHFDGNETTPKMASVILAFHLFVVWHILRLPYVAFRGVARTVERRASRRREDARLKDHPFAGELMRAEANANRLLALPQTPDVKKALKDTYQLIEELQETPTNLSKQSARAIAQDVLRDNQYLRDRPKALLEAQKEIDGSR